MVELIDLVNCYNFSISMTLFRWLTFLLDCHSGCHSHSPALDNDDALLNFFLASDTSICSIMAFPSLGNSDHVAV